jgi:hypothetical protein
MTEFSIAKQPRGGEGDDGIPFIMIFSVISI